MNRVQNMSVISKCVQRDKTNCWHCMMIHEYAQHNGWIEPVSIDYRIQFSAINKIFSKDGSRLVTIEPHLEQNGKSYNHLILIDLTTGSVSQLTKGLFAVTELLAWDEISGSIYFMGHRDTKPDTRHLFRVVNTDAPTCLTCNLKVTTSRNIN